MTLTGDQIVEILSRFPLFMQTSPQQRARLAQGTQELRVTKGEIVAHRGDIPNGFFIVLFGQIKLCVFSEQGDEKVVEIINQRQSFGEAVMFLNRPYPVTASAIQDSLLLHVNQDVVDEQLLLDPTFAKGLLAGLSSRLHTLIGDVETFSLRSTAQRVIGYLLQLADDSADDIVEVDLPVSKLIVASRLSLTPETLSRVFGKLHKVGLIDIQGRSVRILSLRRLKEFQD
jgi:CRP-like cAMP-binding protein